MFDPKQHQLEIRLIAIRRWQDELGRIDAITNPVEKALKKLQAIEQIFAAWEDMMEVLGDG